MNSKSYAKSSCSILSRIRANARLFIWLGICAAACAATVIGCGWQGIENSVRFRPYMDKSEFGRLPPLPMNAIKRTSDSNAGVNAEFNSSTHDVKEINAVWDEAQAAEQRDDPAKARNLLSEYMQRTAAVSCNESYYDNSRLIDLAHCQERRNSIVDQIDALTALDKGSKASAAVHAYLDARRVYDVWLESVPPKQSANAYNFWPQNKPKKNAPTEAETEEAQKNCLAEVRRLLDAMPRDSNIEDNAQYLRAVLLYREARIDEAVSAFKTLAARYPQSEKREAAVFMAARLRMKQSRSYNDDDSTATATEACADCLDEAWRDARTGFLRVMRDYPRGRYADEARGWLAYLDLRVGNTAGALIEYYRLLTNAGDSQSQESVLNSLRLALSLANEADMERVEAMLAAEPTVALTYAYHNIYNYTFSYYLLIEEVNEEENPYSYYKDKYGDKEHDEYQRWEDNKEKSLRSIKERRELARIAAFATRMIRRYPKANVGGAFTLRVAQADLELGDNNASLHLAQRALAVGVKNNERAGALWVKGVAEYRLRDYAAARRTLNALVSEFPHGDLTEGARRLIAMAAEDAGDIGGALEEYLALNYDSDVAYFIDVLMTPEQLAAFIETHPRADNQDELLYALGVRYLRNGLYTEARATFARVRTTQESSDTAYFYERRYKSPDDGESDPKYQFLNDYNYDNNESVHHHGILAQWVLRDIKTADDLQLLERRAEIAVGDEAKAEALYQLASYLYEGSRLVFYNPAAWQSVRGATLVNYDESHYRAPNEAQILWSYMQQHESLSRALVIYLDAARRFPNTRASRDALYTAAVCHERLSTYNDYWRGISNTDLYAGDRMVTYEDVRRIYPHYQLPRGTMGWEPATRTVNGGSGWAAPPKPKPRLTWRARLKQKLLDIYQRALNFWEERGSRWFKIGFLLVCMPFAFRLSKRTRRLLREQLASPGMRLKIESRHENYGLLIASQTPPIKCEVRDRVRANLQGALRQTVYLIFDARGVRTLGLALASHGLLIALLFTLLRTLYA